MCNEHHDEPDLAEVIRLSTPISNRRLFLGAASSFGLLTACGGGGGSSSSSSSSASASSSGSSSSSSSSTSSSSSSSSSSSTSVTSCTTLPTETNGPYPGDGSNSYNGSTVNVLTQSGVVRSDIRKSFGSYVGTAPGVPLTLTITLVKGSNSCGILAGYAIYIWHCTRDGNYTLYSTSYLTENYLRGVQETDANGQCTFTTVMPGCYSGRWPHIHVEVYPSLATATNKNNVTKITQFALPSAICSTVYAGATGYSASVSNFNAISLASDNVFGDNSSAQIAAATPTLTGDIANGYTGTVVLAV